MASAKRARQLQAGARPLISTTSRKPTKIAMEEIRTGAVAAEMNVHGAGGPKASYAALDLPSSTPDKHIAPRSAAVIPDSDSKA